ncbi:hypothetical protein WJX72_001896 [[Myrmecia] bisecta]|uniref:polyribonucleotide nucleotidyltransferase n=1 Tax=[Myrmecia] bisecta TaxID=41462 RepID=A0AAW1PT79_9CHLO
MRKSSRLWRLGSAAVHQAVETGRADLLRCTSARASLAGVDSCPRPQGQAWSWGQQFASRQYAAAAEPSQSTSEASTSGRSAEGLAQLEPGESLQAQCELAGQDVVFEVGKLARLADGSCLVRQGNTHVLATAVCGPPHPYHRPRSNGGIPLQVEYRERMYAAGRIPSNAMRRELNLTEREVLAVRAIDRALRPLFAPGFSLPLQVVANVLSSDGEVHPDTLSINAASAALTCSDIPWAGPVGAVRVGRIGGQLMINPSPSQDEQSDLDLTYVGTLDRAVMVDGQAAQVPEAVIAEALQLAHREAAKLIAPQLELARQAGLTTRQVPLLGADPSAAATVTRLARQPIEAALRDAEAGKAGRARALAAARQATEQKLREMGIMRHENIRLRGSGCASPADIDHAWAALEAAVVRDMALADNVRVDGRGLVDLRPLYCQVNSVPVVHGSALVQRGETQSLVTATVGTAREEQRMDSVLGEDTKRLIVHYAKPAFATNEVAKAGVMSRREQGHSALVERALAAVMPQQEAFPFTLRINADTLEADGSSAMAAVCGGALALADAGVPITSLVAGVSIGLLSEAGPSHQLGETGGQAAHERSSPAASLGRWELLTDLLDMEARVGDMNLRVAGTREGVTVLQLDIQQPGVPLDVLSAALERSRTARHSILDTMQAALPVRRERDAPRFGSVEINRELIGKIIGTGGETIKAMQESTGARITVMDSGVVHFFAPSRAQYAAAVKAIDDVTGASIKEGERYPVLVVKLMDFGAFVAFPNGMQALLHISEISHHKVQSVQDVLQVGQQLEVVCQGRDARGNIKISRKALLPRPRTPDDDPLVALTASMGQFDKDERRGDSRGRPRGTAASRGPPGRY